MPLAVDPTNPAYEARLRAAVRRLLAMDGCDADGFKIDFSARIPSGPAIRLYGDEWGLELMKRYLEILHDETHRVKPEALIMAHTPHPYLAGAVDMIRLNDVNVGHDAVPAMQMRAMVAALACPDALIDTDNWPMRDRAAWRTYTQAQAGFGVPSLYYVDCIDSTGEPLETEDYALLRDLWQKYRAGLSDAPARLVTR
jgi:hypothetical protein